MKASDFISRLSEETVREQAKLVDEAVNTFLTENGAPYLEDVGDKEKLKKAGFILELSQSYHGNIKLELFKKVAAIQLVTEVSTRIDSREHKVVVKKIKLDI